MSRNIPASFLTSLPKESPARDYPFLAYLMGGWFHQDYEYEGDDLEEIVRSFEQTASSSEREETARDIEEFLAKNGANEQVLAVAFEQTFQPEVTIEGWDGMTTRQWLKTVAGYLQDPQA